jgi:hypothetical protein
LWPFPRLACHRKQRNPAKSGDVKRDAAEISNSAQGMCEMHAIRSPCPIKILGLAIAAISLGLAGRHGMSSRVGRNLRFAAAGNALTAAVMGALGTYVSIRTIFIASAILCIPALFALHQIRADEVKYVRARNAAKHDHTLDLQWLVDFAKNRNLLLFAICMVLFHFSNASLLPLVGQNLAHSRIAHGAAFMAGLIVVPQIIVAI